MSFICFPSTAVLQPVNNLWAPFIKIVEQIKLIVPLKATTPTATDRNGHDGCPLVGRPCRAALVCLRPRPKDLDYDLSPFHGQKPVSE